MNHKQVESIYDKYMTSFNWGRIYEVNFNYELFPDRIYSDGNSVIIAELKPDTCRSLEIYKGIGQILQFLPYAAKLYLVISEEHIHYIDVLSAIPDIGIITYGNISSEMKVYKKSIRPEFGLMDIKNIAHKEDKFSISSIEIFDVVNHLKSGIYSFDELLTEVNRSYCVPKGNLFKMLRFLKFHNPLVIGDAKNEL